MTASAPRKPFSMIREFHLADWFTLGNAVCGTAAIFSTITYVQTESVRHIYFACALVFLALVFDVLDGRIARWRQKSSSMGRELDSLADVISFGVAPAMLGYSFGMQGLYDRIVLGYFVACGVSRLARYNVSAEALSDGSGKVKYFEGTPIPTSFLVVCLLTWATSTGAFRDTMWFGKFYIAGHVLHPLALVFFLSGSLMISRIPVPKI
jgi:CDP-diacylglycerol--serine O-phosphatidyltransferase